LAAAVSPLNVIPPVDKTLHISVSFTTSLPKELSEKPKKLLTFNPILLVE